MQPTAHLEVLTKEKSLQTPAGSVIIVVHCSRSRRQTRFSRSFDSLLYLLECRTYLRRGDPRAVCNADGPRVIMSCMNAYSEDLRKKIVEALSRGTTKSEAARSFGVSRSSLKRYAKLVEQGRSLVPKKRPGSKPKVDERARRLLEADHEERPSATLSERREYLGRACGLSVSESTVSRMLRRLGWSRKKDRWQRESATSS